MAIIKYGVHVSGYSRLIVTATLCCGFLSQAVAETIKIGGTGAGLGTMTLLGQAFEKKYPDYSIKLLPSLGTSGGIKALQSGALDLAVTARDINPEEKATGLSATKYGTTAFVFVSHPKTPPQALTKQKIADIYSGKQANWSNGQAMRLVLRPRQDTDTKLLAKLSPEIEAAVGVAHAKSGMVVAITDAESAELIEKAPNSFGTSTLALVLSENRNLNLLPVDGITPSTQTINDGTYAYTKEMYVVTSAVPSNAARQFLQFIRSAQGADILKKTGHKIN